MVLGQLRWLEGFAAGGRWTVVDGEPAEVAVDGLALARARRAINVLRRDHGESLRHLVGDVPAWLATTDGILQDLDAHVHGGRAPGDVGRLAPPRLRSAARALEIEHPRLQPLIRAATSAWVLRPAVLAAAIAWMKPRGESLSLLFDGAGPVELRRGLRLARLGGEGASGVDALTALVRADVPDAQQAGVALANLIGRLRGGKKTVAPMPKRSGEVVIPFVDRLLSREPGERARVLELLAAIDLAGAIEPLRAWEREHAARIARAEALAREQGIDRGAKPEDIGRVIAALEKIKAALPPAVDVADVLKEVEVLSERRFQPFHAAALRLTPELPGADAPLTRVRFVQYASGVAAGAEGDRKAAWLWEALARERAAGAPERMLESWAGLLAGKPDALWPEYELPEPIRRPADVRSFAAALARLARDRPASIEHWRRLAAALGGGLDVEQAVALTAALDNEPSKRLVRAAVALVGPDVSVLAGVLRSMSIRCAEVRGREKALAALCEQAADAGAAWLILGLLAHHGSRALDLAELATCVPRRSWPELPRLSSRPPWIAAYPAALAEPLARLAAADPDAERTARRRVAAVLPERAALEREAAALRARAPLGPREARRLANLEARILAPRPLSRARLERLAGRLDAAAVVIGAARFEAALIEAAQARLTGRLGIEVLPGWNFDRMQRSILMGLVDLDPPDRALAGRLLRARTGPPPWDLRDDPVNKAFLARLRAIGIDPAPWLDDAPRVVPGGDGRPVELAFCHDPLEVFAMGAHFGTCLSPDGGNFFSVITNAADVNKRVLYARRQGAVIGRCLLALTDAGHLLAFHPYAHDSKLDFDAVVRVFAVDLAARMGGHVASAGRVTTLLGSDWYDDGVQDLVGRFAQLEDQAFARAAREVPPSGIVALLEKTLGRGLDDLTLPVVLASTALRERPELILPLAPSLLALSTLPDETLIRAADMATRNGNLDLADRLLLGPATRSNLEHGVWFWGQVLARRRPSFALARLHQTRPRGVRGLAGEQGERLAVAGLALEALRRPRQALTFYRRAIADEQWLESELGPRLTALERPAAR
jgi:hypothetical protein